MAVFPHGMAIQPQRIGLDRMVLHASGLHTTSGSHCTVQADTESTLPHYAFCQWPQGCPLAAPETAAGRPRNTRSVNLATLCTFLYS